MREGLCAGVVWLQRNVRSEAVPHIVVPVTAWSAPKPPTSSQPRAEGGDKWVVSPLGIAPLVSPPPASAPAPAPAPVPTPVPAPAPTPVRAPAPAPAPAAAASSSSSPDSRGGMGNFRFPHCCTSRSPPRLPFADLLCQCLRAACGVLILVFISMILEIVAVALPKWYSYTVYTNTEYVGLGMCICSMLSLL